MLCYVMSTLIRQRALQTWVLSICIIAVLLSLIFYIQTLHSFLHSLLKFYSKQKFVWFCSALYISANSYLFYLVLLLEITLFNTVHRDFEWKKLELTPLSERICGLKLVQMEPRSTRQKRGLCWITNWHSFIVQGHTYDFLWKFREVWDVHVRIHVAPLACYPFINIKLASCHFLLYVVYLCQKS